MISVIVPVYGVEAYLPACLDSVLSQTFPDFELIAVDDGSPDGCGAILDAYAEQDRRIRVIHRENGGLSAARNTGLDAVAGDSVYFLDSDDWILPDTLETLSALQKQHNADIAVGSLMAVYRNQQVEKPEQAGVYTGREALQLLMENKGLHDYACGKLYKTELWKDIRFPEGQVYEDIRTVYKTFLKAGTIAVTDRCGYQYRQRARGIDRGSFRAAKLEQLDAVESYRAVPEIGNDPLLATLLDDRVLNIKCHLLLDMLLSMPEGAWPEFQGTAKTYCKEIRRKVPYILRSGYFLKSSKGMALLTLAGFRAMRAFFRLPNNPVARYYADKYEYFA